MSCNLLSFKGILRGIMEKKMEATIAVLYRGIIGLHMRYSLNSLKGVIYGIR